MPKRERGRVELDVGGERFVSSVSTLSARSAYFEAKFERWDGADEPPEVFLDRDPDAFRVLLSCMRQQKVLLPSNDDGLFRRVMHDAVFLGMDWLLQAVKVKAVDNDLVSTTREFNRMKREEDPTHEWIECQELIQDPAKMAMVFDTVHGGIEKALDSGLLPERFFKGLTQPMTRPVIKQLVPCHTDDAVVFFRRFADAEDEIEDKRRAVCLALVDVDGRTHVEPVVRGRGCWTNHAQMLASGDRWSTVDNDQQLMTASDYAEIQLTEEDVVTTHWAYAYKTDDPNDEIAQEHVWKL